MTHHAYPHKSAVKPLTVSLKRLVTTAFLSTSFSFSLSGSLSVLVGGGSAEVPNMASS
ncbi:uncharacterized protein DS421_16g556710 [Arachis hypogaea]|nr:uncharacterized protein DS421_16g556710 [Arachis hypogaea]